MEDSVKIADDDLSPGWDAVDEALARLYPDQEPRHFGLLIRYSQIVEPPVGYARADRLLDLPGLGASILSA